MSRRLLKHRVDKSTIYLNSIKNNFLCWTESYCEWLFALMQEFNDDVIAYNSQPFSLEYEKVDGGLAEYCVDFLVQRNNGLFAYEIKSGKFGSKERIRAEYEHIKNYLLEHHNLRFDVVFDDDFCPAHTAKNLKFLYKYRWLSNDLINNFNLSKHMDPEFHLGELKEFVAKKHLPNVIPFGLIAHNKAIFDFSEKMTNETILKVA